MTPDRTLRSQESLLASAIELSKSAGKEILAIVRSGELGTREKSDASPVTLADLRANEILLEGLTAVSQAPIVSEESLDLIDGISGWDKSTFWLIDPIDGTRDFVAGRTTYVVNIALIENGVPVLGVIHAPARGETWWALQGQGAHRDGVRIKNDALGGSITALASGSAPGSARSDEFLKKYGVSKIQRFGSALKFALVAQGEGDVYPRFGRTFEWDTAAGHAILNEAGCGLYDVMTGQPLRYGKQEFENGPFAAIRNDQMHFVDAMKSEWLRRD